jgi:hypothetical protein
MCRCHIRNHVTQFDIRVCTMCFLLELLTSSVNPVFLNSLPRTDLVLVLEMQVNGTPTYIYS